MDYLIRFENCLPVKGFSRSLICDIQRQKYYFIPNFLHDLLASRVINIKKELDLLSKEDKETFNEYINFLIENEFVFFANENEIDLFPEISYEWDNPNKISNAILDLNIQSNYDISNILFQLHELDCKNIQIRCFDFVSYDILTKYMNVINKDSRVSFIQIINRFQEKISNEDLKEFLDNNKRVRSLLLYGAKENEVKFSDNQNRGIVYILKETISSSKACGVVSESFFTCNSEHFFESHHNNTCLNRKISIDINGEIKNCPSIMKSFGNVKNTSIIKALNDKEFKKLGNITKNQISVCKDCEFRHICTDCRAFTENPEDIYSKPLKCGYNPYTCEWEEWSTHPMKQKVKEAYLL